MSRDHGLDARKGAFDEASAMCQARIKHWRQRLAEAHGRNDLHETISCEARIAEAERIGEILRGKALG